MEQVKNEKTFFEVFPTLRADGELKMLFQDVEVKKITTNSTREFLHIHMVSHHLIPKKVIWKMEQSIKEQLFWNGIGGNPDRRVLCVIGAVYTGDAACRIQGESCSGTGKEKCTGSQYV